jgi:hypothetical protein
MLDIYWNILTMHGPINVKSPNNTSKWQMGFNSAFKGLISLCSVLPCRQKQHSLYRTCSTIHTSVSRVVARDSEVPPGWVIRLQTTGNTGSEQSLPTTLRWRIGALYGVKCVSCCQCRGPWNLISYVLERVIIFLGFRYYQQSHLSHTLRPGTHYPYVTWAHVMLTRAVGVWDAI